MVLLMKPEDVQLFMMTAFAFTVDKIMIRSVCINFVTSMLQFRWTDLIL